MPDVKDEAETKPVALEFDELETAKMASIQEEKRKLKERNDMYNAREAFLGLVKARSTTITDEVRKTHPKMKDLCGFDPRIAWSDEEFVVWYTQKGGKEVLEAGADAKIGPPDEHDGSVVNGIAGRGRGRRHAQEGRRVREEPVLAPSELGQESTCRVAFRAGFGQASPGTLSCSGDTN
jgi:hypothetical protein